MKAERHQGSRGHLLDLVDGEDWWSRLNSLIASADAHLDEGSHHVPIGSDEDSEWDLAKFCQAYCVSDMKVERFASWWVKSGRAPMWDLIATCQIDGRPGLLIVEAKAHENEMHREGKSPPKATNTRQLDVSDLSRGLARSLINHGYIGRCIHEARDALREHIPTIAIDRDSNYQLSNRIASAWKLADCGMPVVLLYLGSIGDEGMAPEGKPFRDGAHWEAIVRSHLQGVGAAILPATYIVLTNGCPIRFRIGSLDAQRQSILNGLRKGGRAHKLKAPACV